jgi:hypothetical protein
MCLCGRRRARRRCAECGSAVARHEMAVREALEADYRLHGFVWDARSSSSLSSRQCTRRPDFLWTFEAACVALEVDENEHAGYDAEDEARRTREIEDSMGRPVFWVRVRVARGATHEATGLAVVAAADNIAELISLARKKVGDSKTKDLTIRAR